MNIIQVAEILFALPVAIFVSLVIAGLAIYGWREPDDSPPRDED